MRFKSLGGICLILLFWGFTFVPDAYSQRPPRQIRTYVPPDQLVSFRPDTHFNQFLEFINPIFERVTGKTVIDPEARQEPIGIAITSMQFFDALEFVLEIKGLTYRETDKYYLIEVAQQTPIVLNADQGTGQTQGTLTIPATASTREVQINAILFDADLTKSLELGVDWSVWFGPNAGGGGAGGGGGGGGTGGGGAGGQGTTGSQIPQLFLNTRDLFDSLEDYIVGPDQIGISALAQLLRVFETEGLGKTIANPQVTVQSGQKGNIQIGSDVPVQQRDFAGNTITQFFQTGIIIDVTPTVIQEVVTDTLTGGTTVIEFIHLDVSVENSQGRPTAAGTVIDRNKADTQVLLLDGEQTLIGGLYSTDKGISRRGIPILKDLPPWFFGLRYLFGYNRTDVTQRELLIILQARILDPLNVRIQRPFEDQVLERRRRQLEEDLRRLDPGAVDEIKYPADQN